MWDYVIAAVVIGAIAYGMYATIWKNKKNDAGARRGRGNRTTRPK